MTETQKATVDKFRRYFENIDEYTYKTTIYKAIHDKNFEKLIQSMTIDIISPKKWTNNGKYKYDSKFIF